MRQQINIKLPEALLSALREHCRAAEINYTAFIEQAIRERLAKDGVFVSAPDSGWRWKGDIDEMPFDI